jgi:hypothetical protein
MKGASLVVYVNADGEVIHAANVDPKTGEILEGPIQYGPEENGQNKKIFGGVKKTMLRYPNSCCWRQITGNGWVCGPCP